MIDKQIEDLDITDSILRAFRRVDIKTFQDVLDMERDEFRSIKNVGKVAFKEILSFIERYGYEYIDRPPVLIDEKYEFPKSINIEKTSLDERTIKRLKLAGVTTSGELFTMPKEEVLKISSLSDTSIEQIDNFLIRNKLKYPKDLPVKITEDKTIVADINDTLEDMKLSKRIMMALKLEGITTFKQLLELSKADLLEIDDISEGMVNRLANFLHTYGYKFTSSKPVLIDAKIPYEGGVLIENSQLPNTTKEILIGRGIKTLDDLVNTDKELIKTYRGIGKVSMEEIEGFLESNNLKYPEIRIDRIVK